MTVGSSASATVFVVLPGLALEKDLRKAMIS
jgi:hypothetical protein